MERINVGILRVETVVYITKVNTLSAEITPEEEAIKDIEVLINDIYKEILSWVPSWISSKVIPPSRTRILAKRIMSISQKYVDAKAKAKESKQ